MPLNISADYFLRAAKEIGRSGDNDTLPYDPDARFVKEKSDDMAALCMSLFAHISNFENDEGAKGYINSLELFSERLLAPAGSHGFRIVTKIHPFWNVYLNGLAAAISEQIESRRSARVFSYRAASEPDRLFDLTKTWRAYKQATADQTAEENDNVIVQTDISSFYERSIITGSKASL